MTVEELHSTCLSAPGLLRACALSTRAHRPNQKAPTIEVVKWLERGWKPVYQPHFWTAATGRIQKVYYDAQKRLVLIEHSHTHTHTHTHTHLPSLTLLYAEAQRGSSHPSAG